MSIKRSNNVELYISKKNVQIHRPAQSETPPNVTCITEEIAEKQDSIPQKKASTVDINKCKVPADFDSDGGQEASDRLLMRYVILYNFLACYFV